MNKSFADLLKMLLPLSKEKKGHVQALREYLEKEEISYIKYLLKMGKIGVSYETLGVSKALFKEDAYPQFHLADDDGDLKVSVTEWNKNIFIESRIRMFHRFSEVAAEKIPLLIAPHIIGFDEIKLATSWQLFCPERIHILLLGDPGTGKTDILRGAAQYAHISSFGLGSGTSGVGLVAAKKGDTIVKGLLPLAHNGICCIDELNLLKPKDRGALLNAMEKGFVTYDKGTSHLQLPAKVRVLATANPKGDRFIGENIKFLKEQMPFDPALLSRFHLLFFLRKPDLEAFMKITKSIVNESTPTLKKEDVEFIKEYVKFAQDHKVEFNKALEPVVSDYFEDIKKREKDLLIELSPRLVLGVVRLSKAVARMQLRDKVVHDDLIQVLTVVHKSLKIPEDILSKKVRQHTGRRQ